MMRRYILVLISFLLLSGVAKAAHTGTQDYVVSDGEYWFCSMGCYTLRVAQVALGVTESETIYEPDVLAGKFKYYRLMFLDDVSYPQGVQITDLRYDLSTNDVTYTFTIKSMTDLNGTGVATVHSCVVTNAWTREFTGLSLNIGSNVLLVLELPATDVNEIGLTWRFFLR